MDKPEEIEMNQIKNEYEAKILNLRNVLTKAKQAYEQQKALYIEKSSELDNAKNHISHLESIVQKYVYESEPSNEKKNFDFSKIKKILARIIIDGINWICYKSDNSIEWIREEIIDVEIKEINNDNEKQYLIGDINCPEILDYNYYFENKKNELKKKKNYQDDLSNVIKQYESRINRIQEAYEQTEKKLIKSVDENKILLQNVENTKEELSQIAIKLIDESEQIRENCLLYLHEESDETTKNNCLNKMKFLLIELQKLNYKYQFSSINDIKDNILLLHQTLYDLLKKLNASNIELHQQEKAWRKMSDKLIAEKEVEKKEKIEILESGRKKIKELELLLETIQIESAKQIKERELKIDYLNKELKKNVNTQYIKNILLKFFDSDLSVQEKTLPVIATVLQFSPQETEILRANWDEKSKKYSITNILNFGKGSKK